MVKKIVLLAVLGLLAINTVSAIKCYQCEDCTQLKDEDKKVCTEDSFSTTLAPTSQSTTTLASTTKETTTLASTTEDTTLATTTEDTSGGNPKSEKKIYRNKYNRKDEEKEDEPEDNDFRCLKYTNKDEKIVRTCTKRSCKTLNLDDCRTCEEDGCNFATNIQSWAFSTIILVAVVKYFL